jgi:hypothetical protein
MLVYIYSPQNGIAFNNINDKYKGTLNSIQQWSTPQECHSKFHTPLLLH